MEQDPQTSGKSSVTMVKCLLLVGDKAGES